MLRYTGISAKQMQHDFRGEAIYTAEVCLGNGLRTVMQG